MDLIDKQVVIDTEGLDVQIRCEMCRNPMHTNRGCDGNCKCDEKLYERIMQILDERIKPLPSAQPEIIRCEDCYHYAPAKNGCNGICAMHGSPMDSFDWCSRAERKENR